MTDNEIIKDCGVVCGDNRFELIKKYKQMLFEQTNIETANDQIAVIDGILFRFWQMGWLDKLEEFDRQKAEIDILIRKKESLRDEISDLKAEVERLHKLQKPTETSGFIIQNGKVVFYTNILNGYRHEFKDLEAVVRDLNLMLQNSYKNDQIIGFYKNTIENQVSELKTAKSEAIKEFAERLKEKFIHKGKSTKYGEFTWDDVTSYELDNLVKEMTERKE